MMKLKEINEDILIKNKKPKNYYSKFIVGDPIKTLNDLIKEENIIYVNGNFRKTYNRGWFMSFQLHYVLRLIEDGAFHYAIPKLNREEF